MEVLFDLLHVFCVVQNSVNYSHTSRLAVSASYSVARVQWQCLMHHLPTFGGVELPPSIMNLCEETAITVTNNCGGAARARAVTANNIYTMAAIQSLHSSNFV